MEPRLPLLLLVSLFLLPFSVLSQHSLLVKAGFHSSRQRYQNIPVDRNSFVAGYDTVASSTDENDGKVCFNLMGFYEFRPNHLLSLQLGAGFRQKGFKSTARYNSRTGIAEKLPE